MVSLALWGTLAVSVAVSAIVLVFLRPVLTRLGVVDIPNDRSSHDHPVLRGGGVGPLVGFIVGWVVSLFFLPQPMPFLAIGAAAVAVGLLGLLEDLRGVGVAARAAAQILLGAALAAALALNSDSAIWLVPLGAVWFAAFVNFTNFMDGINGLSGMFALVAGVAYLAIGGITGHAWLSFGGLLVAGAFGVFLFWNLGTPGMFLGDVGSYLLGGAVAAMSLMALLEGVPALTVVGPIALYLFDTSTVLVRRVAKGEPVFQAHRTHAYQRLTDLGFSHGGVAVGVAALTLTTSAFGVAYLIGGLPFWLTAVLQLAVCVGFVALPWLLSGHQRRSGGVVEPNTGLPIGEGNSGQSMGRAQ